MNRHPRIGTGEFHELVVGAEWTGCFIAFDFGTGKCRAQSADSAWIGRGVIPHGLFFKIIEIDAAEGGTIFTVAILC